MLDKKIVLATLNSRFSHTSIALRYLFANLENLQDDALILEFVINEDNSRIAEQILKYNPKIIGLGVYIWNAKDIEQIIKIIKKISPQTIIILGGPEVSYEPFRVDFSQADFIIQGEGERPFFELCTNILNNKKMEQRLFPPSMQDFASLETPYRFYNENDIQNRHIYFEASRGCPFHCEFCLSSIDNKMRYLSIEQVLVELEFLWQKGARNFKFIDRTFNVYIEFGVAILEYFLAKKEDYFLHFEVIPDNFPENLKNLIAKFHRNSLQLEVGLQTLNQQVAKNIKRNLRLDKIKENLHFLNHETTAHLHVDLIVGLPGETLESFGANLDELINLTKSEIQIGILKKLSGTTLGRHDEIFGNIWSDLPPYDILQNNLIDFFAMQRMKRFSRFWDIVYNSGNFKNIFDLLIKDGKIFDKFLNFTDFVFENAKSTSQISPQRMATFLHQFLLRFEICTDSEFQIALEKDFEPKQSAKSAKKSSIKRQENWS